MSAGSGLQRLGGSAGTASFLEVTEGWGSHMADVELLDRGYAAIMNRVVETAEAPHFTDLATELGIDLDDARELVHELVASTPGWVHPGTDLIASFPPFNLQPTQYRVTIDGRPGWYAQCGFEALAIRWLVPGATVRIDAPCLCCGDSITVEMDSDSILEVAPAETVGYTSSEVGGDASTRPFR